MSLPLFKIITRFKLQIFINMKTRLNEKRKDSRMEDFRKAVEEQDIMKLRNQLVIINRSQLTKNH